MGLLNKDTLERLSQVQAGGGSPRAVTKAITQATGIVNYDLRPALRRMYPVLFPLAAMLPREVRKVGDTATRWKSVVAINPTSLRATTGEGNRGASLVTAVRDFVAPYMTLAYDDSVTFQADWAAGDFDNAKEAAVLGLLHSLRIEEDKLIYGGNRTYSIGQPGVISLADSATGGAINANTQVFVTCFPLTYEGWQHAPVSSGVVAAASALTVLSTKTNADGSTDLVSGGVGIPAVVQNITTANDGNNTHAVTAVVPTVQGAVAYAWFWGSNATTTCWLGAITNTNTVTMTTALGVSTATGAATAAQIQSGRFDQVLTATDYSANGLGMDGLLYFAFGAGQQINPVVLASGALVSVNNDANGVATTLTANGAGGISEIDADLFTFYTNWKIGPSDLFVSAQQAIDINNKVIAGGGAPLFRFNLDRTDTANALAEGIISAGSAVGSYLNKFTNTLMKVVVYPWAVPGTMFYYTREIPYYGATQKVPAQMTLRQEYMQREWPIVRPRYEFGILMDGVLQMYFPFGMGVRYNIAQG